MDFSSPVLCLHYHSLLHSRLPLVLFLPRGLRPYNSVFSSPFSPRFASAASSIKSTVFLICIFFIPMEDMSSSSKYLTEVTEGEGERWGGLGAGGAQEGAQGRVGSRGVTGHRCVCKYECQRVSAKRDESSGVFEMNTVHTPLPPFLPYLPFINHSNPWPLCNIVTHCNVLHVVYRLSLWRLCNTL